MSSPPSSTTWSPATGSSPPVSSSLLEDLHIRYARDVPLGPLTWYGVGGKAAVLAHPGSREQLSALTRRCHEQGVPMRMLGSGANLLVADRGVDGVVVSLDHPAFSGLERRQNTLKVGAGFDLMKLVLEAARQGLAGLETVAGIPASVGGAVRMNAGGAFGDIAASVARVHLLSEGGQIHTRRREDLHFGYRKTHIEAPCILGVEFDLTEDDPAALMQRVKEIFTYKKTTQPMAKQSAGCAFKNPRMAGDDLHRDSAEADTSRTAFGHDPPRSAGALIDRAGLKGHRIGGAEVSSRHANFIFTHPGCVADDVLALMNRVQHVVGETFGVKLEREVVVWP